VRGIRDVDSSSSIGMISAEADPPYRRPPLTKGLWKGQPLEEVWLPLKDRGVELHLDREVRGIDTAGKQVFDSTGATYTFDKLLLATGGTPRSLPFAGADVIYFRTLQDYRRLREVATGGARVAVIGGGFIGSEIAAALVLNGCEPMMLFPETSVCSRIFPADLAAAVTELYRSKGVEVLGGESVVGVEDRGGRRAVLTAGGRQLMVNAIVAGLGLLPNVALAQGAGIRVENGILVDEQLRTSHPDVYAAGDVATFWSPALGVRIRVEHEDNAMTQGTSAGRLMAGGREPYHHLPFFYSDLFELGYEAVGRVDPALETFADWKDPFREGAVYYLLGGRVKGVLLWNVWGKVDAAREMISRPELMRPQDLRGRITN
jgi:3-phenylpropionate/trans-cinnamate dioxygenase ferredoxin reductase subunit